MGYRDPLGSLRATIEVKLAVLADAKRRLTPIQYALLPQSIRHSMARLEPRASTDLASLATIEAISELDTALEELLTVYQAAQAGLSHWRMCPGDLGEAPRLSPMPFVFEEPGPEALRNVVQERAEALGLGSRATRCGDRDVFAELDHGAFRSHFVVRLANLERVSTYECSLRVTLPPHVEPLLVVAESAASRLGQFLGILADGTVDHPAFDAAFRLSGSLATAALLTDAVRQALLRLHAASATTSLQLNDAAATLAWSHSPEDCSGNPLDLVLPDAALDAIIYLRAAVANA